MRYPKSFIEYTLELCLSLSNDINFKKVIEESTHRQRMKFLKDHGFTLVYTKYRKEKRKARE